MEDMKKSSELELTEDATANMKKTYVTQRKDINSKTFTMSCIKKDWPFLFKGTHMFDHFNMLTGVDIEKMMAKAFESKVPKLIAFMKTSAKSVGN